MIEFGLLQSPHRIMRFTHRRTRARKCRALYLLLLILFLFVPGTSRAETRYPQRILSVTPAGTEILFDLGLGDRVVGVTQYCNWPPEAREKPSIGDMMHVNLEVIAGLAPDLVLLSNMNEHLKRELEAFGYPVAVVNQDDFEQICDSMIRVGRICGIADRAEKRVRELREEVARISSGVTGNASPRVLIVVGRDTADDLFRKVYIAGRRSFYDNLLAEAGAHNAYTGDVQYAQISRESLIRLDPDVVIELVGEHGGANLHTGDILAQWRAFDDLRAARTGDIAIIKGDFTLRAGPRYPLVLEAFIRAIHGGEREIEE